MEKLALSNVPSTSRHEIVAALQHSLRRLEGEQHPELGCISSGSIALDQILPQHGLRRGTLVEWLGDEGSGAATLALAAAREACRGAGALVVMDGEIAGKQRFYPPAIAGLNMDLRQVIVVRPATPKDYRWALSQALHCRGVSAVLGWPQKLDSRSLRQFQLAAETGGSLGLLVRPTRALGKPTWADVQLLIHSLPTLSQTFNRRLRVEVSQCRGKSGGQVEVEVDCETGLIHDASTLPLASPLVHSASVQRPARA